MRVINFFGILIILLISGCNNQNKIRIEGSFPDHAGEKLVLMESGIEKNTRLDSVKIKKNGHFRFAISSGLPRFYYLELTNSTIIPLLLEPGENAKIVATPSRESTEYTVEGSKGSESLRMLDKEMANTRRQLDSLDSVYRKLITNSDDNTLLSRLRIEYDSIIKAQRKYNTAFIISNLNSMASLYALYQKFDSVNMVFSRAKDIQYYKLLSDTLTKYYPKSEHVLSLKNNADALLNNFYTQRSLELAERYGKTRVPDLEMYNITGQPVKLSSLMGKIVLLTFWDPTDQYTLQNNLQLMPIYKKYKKRGFEIYQVAIETSFEKWKNAVALNELPWINVSDLKGVKSYAVAVYNLDGLPANFLIDKDQQTVLGKNLDPGLLEIKLEQYLK